MLNSGRLQIPVEIEFGTAKLCCPRRDLFVPGLSHLLFQPTVDRLTGQRRRRNLRSFSFRLQAGVRFIRQWQVEILHAYGAN